MPRYAPEVTALEKLAQHELDRLRAECRHLRRPTIAPRPTGPLDLRDGRLWMLVQAALEEGYQRARIARIFDLPAGAVSAQSLALSEAVRRSGVTPVQVVTATPA